ncbi:hypothetical protein TNIN_116961 [Trichonephila inaurata madagascariensis]|uniref:Uncharacterized protein n=1 Tax=Trichonephila inaurata madagascariensis TaxID=2747483 RepID=A0A8X6YH24_9ARAC|nr:hypothetical protein TNIN_116961 [Trichonephila inaurata madagascariensis]
MDAMLRRLEEEGAAATARPALRVHRATSQAVGGKRGGIRSTAASPISRTPPQARAPRKQGKQAFGFCERPISLCCPLPIKVDLRRGRGSMFPCGCASIKAETVNDSNFVGCSEKKLTCGIIEKK